MIQCKFYTRCKDIFYLFQCIVFQNIDLYSIIFYGRQITEAIFFSFKEFQTAYCLLRIDPGLFASNYRSWLFRQIFGNVKNADNSIYAFRCGCDFNTFIALVKLKSFATPLGENVGLFNICNRTLSRSGWEPSLSLSIDTPVGG